MSIETERKIAPDLGATAEGLRELFKESEVLCIHLIGTAGSGKTCLLEKTLTATQSPDKVAIVLGDATADEEVHRLQRFGGYVKKATVPLNALALFNIVSEINLDHFELLLVEDTRSPMLAAGTDLGEHAQVAVLSVGEGENQALIAAPEFREAELCVINKIDLLPNTNFNVALASKNVAAVHHGIQVLEISCRTGEGLDQWLRWIECRKEKEFPTPLAQL